MRWQGGTRRQPRTPRPSRSRAQAEQFLLYIHWDQVQHRGRLAASCKAMPCGEGRLRTRIASAAGRDRVARKAPMDGAPGHTAAAGWCRHRGPEAQLKVPGGRPTARQSVPNEWPGPRGHHDGIEGAVAAGQVPPTHHRGGLANLRGRKRGNEHGGWVLAVWASPLAGGAACEAGTTRASTPFRRRPHMGRCKFRCKKVHIGGIA